MLEASSESGSQVSSAGVFVGRHRELGELRSALEESLAGRGQMVMLVGEPGIGKTRTAQELTSYAETLGARVLWGRCYEEEGAPPFWPWVQSIGSFINQLESDQLRSAMGPGASHIAEMVPSLREKLPDLPDSPQFEPEPARFRLFDSVTNFLKNASQTRPLVIVLDDLHWGDHASLMLLEFLARGMAASNLLLVGTYRDVEVSRQHPLSQTLGSLMREQLFRRVQLGGLTQQEVSQVAELSAGVTLPANALDLVHRRTEGNPLFVNEIVRLLNQGEVTTDRGWAATVPEGIRDAIGRRLNRLSSECNRVLTTAAVVGRQFNLDLLEELSSDFSEDQLLELLDEALKAGVLEEVRVGAGRFQFQHALIQETLVSEISAARQVRLHARIGVALEELYGSEVESHAAELAHHFAEAEPVLGTEKLVRYSLAAGEQALAAYAWEGASSLFQRALDAKQGQAMDGDRAALLYGLGRSQAAIVTPNTRRESLATLTRAFDFYFESGDVKRAVTVAGDPLFFGFEGSGASEVGVRALSMVAPDSHAAARILSQYGIQIDHETADYQRAKKAFARAEAIAHREGDAILEAEALCNAAHVDADEFRWAEALEKTDHAVRLYPQVLETETGYARRRSAVDSLWGLGDLNGAQPYLEDLLASAQRNQDTRAAFFLNTAAAYHNADWDAVRSMSDRGLETGLADGVLLSFRAWTEYQVGEINQGDIYLDRLIDLMRGTPPGPNQMYCCTALVIGESSRISGQTNRLDRAQEAANVVLASQFAIPRFAMPARVGLGLLAVQRGDSAGAAEQYAVLNTVRGTFVLTLDLGCVDRRLGLLSQTMGNLNQAVSHSEDALAFCRRAGHRPELAWTCCDYADALCQRDGPGDQERAAALLDESLNISTELGMRPLMERAALRREAIETQPAAPATYPDGLTQREVEVLRLLALGRNNREVAEELVISLRTVAHHVTSILNKTGAANRTEAAAYAARQGLVSW